MIQRIQTLYLVAMIILTATLCSGSIIHVRTTDPQGVSYEYSLNIFYYVIKQNGIIQETSVQYPLIVIAAMVIGMSLAAMFSFKDRRRQMKFVRINFMMVFLLFAAVCSIAVMKIPGFSLRTSMPYSVFGIAIMFFMFYLNWRTLRLIKKDEELVKSADRLR